MKLLTNCLFCGSDNHRFCFCQSDYIYDVAGIYDVHECCDCGLLFLNPQPEPLDLAPHYPSNYYSHSGEEDPFAARDEELYRSFYGTGANFISKLRCWPLRFHLRTVTGGPGTRLLDIGCGAGYFLATMKNALNFDVYGVEPWGNDDSFSTRYGLTIFHGTLKDAAFPDGFFDIVTMNQVLEHVSDPKAYIQEICRILRPGGTLVLGVPNANALLYRLFGKRWAALDVPRHLFIPSVDNLGQLCAQEGFILERVRFNGFPDAILRTLLLCLGVRHQDAVPLTRVARLACLPIVYLLNFLRAADTVELTFHH